VPLGGDGFNAPFAAYSIKDFKQIGDASGGTVTFSINMDNRYTSFVSWLSVVVVQGTAADQEYRVFQDADRSAGAAEVLDAVASSVLGGNTISIIWRPPGVIMPGGGNGATCGTIWKNVDLDQFRLDAHIYLFDIRAREKTPMGWLLWSRGAI